MKQLYLAFTLIAISFSTSSWLGGPIIHVKNFHKVSKTLYRSAQPNEKEMKELQAFGVKSILNLRNIISDKQETKKTSLNLIEIPIRTKKITYQNMVNALKAYNSAPKPVLIHCRRGSDRTGCFVACYRMIFEDVSREDAKKELLNEDLGYYQNLFPNIAEFIDTVNIDRLKTSVLE